MEISNRIKKQAKAQAKGLDMRDYIQFHLDLYGLGKLVAVDGPNRGGSHRDQSWYELAIKYRPPGNENARDIQFYDKRIEVYLGYKRTGTYWNRRQIRLAIEKEARKVREVAVVEKVWARAQLSIESGRGRSANGAFEL